MKIAIAHDYLLQFGGAERVVESWSSELPDSGIHCLAYVPERTFPVFQTRSINPTIRSAGISTRLEALLPLLPYFARRTVVPAADLAIVSTSGWAHQFTFNSPTVAYVHSPARWLYAADDYKQNLALVKRVGLKATSRHLRKKDKPAMLKMDVLIANSRTTRDRIRVAYGRDAEVVHPPVRPIDAEPTAPSRALPEQFSIVACRSRGYKNIPLAIDASLRASLPCVVVGAGSERYDAPELNVYGVGRVSDAELRWLYQRATVVIGSAHEDFGLTVLEAGLEGTPAAAIPVGGYLESIHPTVSGELARGESVEELSNAISTARTYDRANVSEWARSFSIDAHMNRLLEIGRTIL